MDNHTNPTIVPDASGLDISSLIEKFETEFDLVTQQLEELQGLVQRREYLWNVITSLKQLRGDSNPHVPTPPPTARITTPGSRYGVVFGLDVMSTSGAPLWVVAQHVLGRATLPMTAKEIVDAITQMGRTVDGKTPTESVRTTLIRKPDVFKRLKDGRFWLMDREPTKEMRTEEQVEAVKMLNRADNALNR
jgi:hypothetical protein